ncbi:hypothetical protein BaRGS_00006721, partial [Batillaria attramentaria]
TNVLAFISVCSAARDTESNEMSLRRRLALLHASTWHLGNGLVREIPQCNVHCGIILMIMIADELCPLPLGLEAADAESTGTFFELRGLHAPHREKIGT